MESGFRDAQLARISPYPPGAVSTREWIATGSYLTCGQTEQEGLARKVLKPLLSYANARIGIAATHRQVHARGRRRIRPQHDRHAQAQERAALTLNRRGSWRAVDTDQAGEGIRRIELANGMARLTKGSSVPYTRAQEDGFDGTVEVPEHSRTSKLGNRYSRTGLLARSDDSGPSLSWLPALERETPRIIARAKKLLAAFLDKLTGGAPTNSD